MKAPAFSSWVVWSCLGIACVACGGSSPPPATPDDAVEAEEPPASESSEGDADEEAEPEEPSESEEGSSEASASGEPDFKSGSSVDEALAAVPDDLGRENIDLDALGAPLKDPAVYEPCKLGGQHFSLRVAVWDGRAVGIDVKAKNEKLAECVRSQIEKIEWRDKVKSLNTIEYSM